MMSKVLTLRTTDERLFNTVNSLEDLFIYKVWIEPVLRDKVVVTFIEGKSGSGKSTAMVALEMHIERIFQKYTGIRYPYDVIKQNVFVPQEYHRKLEWWTQSPAVVMGVDELRFLLPKNQWASLLSQSIGEINETIRALKSENMAKKHGLRYGGVIIYNSQTLTDVVKDTRKTIDVDIILERPSDRVFLKAYTFWVERKDIEHLSIKQKRLEFDFDHVTFRIASSSQIKPPPADVMNLFIKHSVEAKGEIFRRKRDKIIRELERQLGAAISIEEQLRNDEIWNMVMKLAHSRKGKIYWTKESRGIIMKMFNLSQSRFYKDFVPAFEKVAKEKGLM